MQAHSNSAVGCLIMPYTQYNTKVHYHRCHEVHFVDKTPVTRYIIFVERMTDPVQLHTFIDCLSIDQAYGIVDPLQPHQVLLMPIRTSSECSRHVCVCVWSDYIHSIC